MTVLDRHGAEAFVLRIGRALHEAGAPSHRIEDAMTLLAPRLGVEGQFFTTPTSIFASFGPPNEARTALLRVEPAAVNLERMMLVDEVLDRVGSGALDVAGAHARLDAIAKAPERYGPLVSILCFALASGTVARFLDGGVREIVAATAIGAQTGIFAQLATRRRAAARVFEWCAALAASAAAVAWAALIGPMAPGVAAEAGLIVLIPGLALTVAMSELATKNLVSGTARLAGAGLTFLAIGSGLALGARLAPLAGERALVAPLGTLAPWTLVPALALSAIALTVLFRARPREAGIIFLAGTIAFATARIGARLGGGEIGMLAAALATGITGNLYARITRRPAAIAIVPAIILLVPGTLGVRSIATLVEHEVLPGVALLFSLVVFAGALTAGLLFANLLLPPRKSL